MYVVCEFPLMNKDSCLFALLLYTPVAPLGLILDINCEAIHLSPRWGYTLDVDLIFIREGPHG